MEKSRRLRSGEEVFELKTSGEEGIHQIKALLGFGDLVTNVNIPNLGQIEGLRKGAVVETNALLCRDSIKPVIAGRLPDDVNSLVERHVTNQETTLKAALLKDRELAFRAFANDPLMAISIRDARELFVRMLKNTDKYLPGWDI
jgi:alpha-galactosidase